ncbi:MAG: hypothetical protein ACOYN3_06060 [Acidimicrobiia bacterium]
MSSALFPELTHESRANLCEAWVEHVAATSSVPSLLVAGDEVFEAELLERDVLRRIARTPSIEVLRRLGDMHKARPGEFSIQQGHIARLSRWHTVGMQAILRMVATGRLYHADDLDVLIAGGPSDGKLRPIFADAATTLTLAQRELHVRFADRIGASRFRPEITNSARVLER